MKSSQAAALREKWSQLINPLPCGHLTQEMEDTAGVYLTGPITASLRQIRSLAIISFKAEPDRPSSSLPFSALVVWC
jgi:hypothetical protein